MRSGTLHTVGVSYYLKKCGLGNEFTCRSGMWVVNGGCGVSAVEITAPTIVLGGGVAHQHSPPDSRNELVRSRGCRGHQLSGIPTEFKDVVLREQRPKAETNVRSGEERRMEKKKKRVMRKDLRRKLFWGS